MRLNASILFKVGVVNENMRLTIGCCYSLKIIFVLDKYLEYFRNTECY